VLHLGAHVPQGRVADLHPGVDVRPATRVQHADSGANVLLVRGARHRHDPRRAAVEGDDAEAI